MCAKASLKKKNAFKRNVKHIEVKQRRNRKHKTSKRKSPKSITFSKLVRGVRDSIKKKPKSTLNGGIKAAIRYVKDMKQTKTVNIPRILKLPKFGGSIQAILPILSTLSALGSITSSVVGVAKAIKDIEYAKKQMTAVNQNRGTTDREKIIGSGLHIIHKKTAKGSGFYLKPYQQQR